MDTGFSQEDAAFDEADELVALCLERDPSDRSRVLGELCRRYPEHAESLRRRMSALERVGIAVFDAPAAAIPERLGEFELRERLGGGGMGVVYRALQRSLGREVALKLIRPELMYFPKARERFRREAEAIARLSHPSIVPIFQFGEEQRVPYFAMGLIDGPSLARVLDSVRGRAPESLRGADLLAALDACAAGRSRDAATASSVDRSRFDGEWQDAALRIVREIALALEHAHGRGVLHRDVKPSNIALTRDGRVLLFDFGLTLASGDERMTRSGAHSGTLPYMAPEQISGGAVDARADVYALGVTLYELLTLQLPHAGDDALSTQQRILAGRIDSIRSRNRRVRPDVETVCSVALSAAPDQRYASAADFARDLGNALAQRPIEARLPGPLSRAARWARTHRTLAATAGAAFVLAVGTPLALWRQSQGHAHELSELLEVERDLRTRADNEAAAARRAEARAKEAEAAAGSQRDVALAERQASDETLTFVLDMLAQASPKVIGSLDVTPLQMLERGVLLVERRLGSRPVAAARANRTLGRVFLDYAQYSLAAEQLERALDRLSDPQVEAPSELVARCLGELGDAYLNIGRRADARRCAEQLLAIIPPDDPTRAGERAGALLLAATLAIQEGRTEETFALSRELEALAPSLEGTREQIGALNGFAAFLCGTGESERAMLVAEQVIRRRIGESPQDDVDTAIAHLTRGVALGKLGRRDEARRAFDCALDCTERNGWADAATAVVILANIGSLEQQAGRFERAAPYFDEARELALRRLGRRHALYANTLESSESAAAALERWERAFDLQRELLELRIRNSGVDSLEAARAREELARCCERLDRLDEALDERLAAQQIYEDRGELAAARKALTAVAHVQERLGLLDEAVASWKDALDRALEANAPQAESVAARAELARVLRLRGEGDAADSDAADSDERAPTGATHDSR